MQLRRLALWTGLLSLLLSAPISLNAQDDCPPEGSMLAFDVAEFNTSSIVHLELKRRKAHNFLWLRKIPGVSSGVFITPGFILTAGHNVKSTYGSYLVRGRLRRELHEAAYAESIEYADRCNMTKRVRAKTEYRLRKKFQHDFALIQVSSDHPSSFITYPTVTVEEFVGDMQKLVDMEMVVIGYPAGKECGDSKRMIYAPGKFDRVDTVRSLGYHTAFTEAGTSGSAVFVKHNGDYAIIGIHVASGGGTVLLTEHRMKQIEKWKKSLGKDQSEIKWTAP